ncbi:outer membrane protein [Candidatus Paracaedibacter symbiosus]|uniref:outer membrane protein n=1 Tax=Candidatus Paracaedibacter symbiosus TaxID=244582 RepID=UPI000509F24D|nr:outer membrane beta-barrel protein [Candidatus Paracaedibacter symbiosus]
MKKLALALVASSFVAGAATADINTGFYLGAGIGAGSVNANIQDSVNNLDVKSNIGRSRIEGSLYAGYGFVTGCTYLGGEFGYTFAGAKVGQSVTVGNLAGSGFTIQQRNIWNFAVLAGQKVSPSTMIYARLGLNLANYKLEAFETDAGVTTQYPGDSKNKASFAPGLGIETAVTKNVRVRLQYVYDLGAKIGDSNVRAQSATLGVAYKF